MYSFDVTPHAEEDLAHVRGADRRQAAYIAAHLRELDDDPYRVGETATPGRSDFAIEKVEPVARLLAERRLNCQLVRYRDVRDWRLIFGVDHRPASARLILLAIMPRALDYADEALWDRVERDYVDVGLARLP